MLSVKIKYCSQVSPLFRWQNKNRLQKALSSCNRDLHLITNAILVEKRFLDCTHRCGTGRGACWRRFLPSIHPRCRQSCYVVDYGNCRHVWRRYLGTCVPSLLSDQHFPLADSKWLAEVPDPIINHREDSTYAKSVKRTGMVARSTSNRLQEKPKKSHRLDLARRQVALSARTDATRCRT